MKKEKILERIRGLEPWWHCIDLGEGIKTKVKSICGEPVDHPAAKWAGIKDVLPKDLTGKRVLDVGCNAGFFSIEAKRRNAAYVLGVDSHRMHIEQARFVRRILDIDVDFRRMSVYDLSKSDIGQFDVILALGLIYHCKHPLLAVQNMASVAKEILIVESAIIPPKVKSDKFKIFESRPVYTLKYVENQFSESEGDKNWFLFSLGGLKAIFRSAGFIEVNEVEVRGNRAILLCRKNAHVFNSQNPGQLEAALITEISPQKVLRDSPFQFRIGVTNKGDTVWLADRNLKKGFVRLGAHLLDHEGDLLIWDYSRAELSQDMPPGTSQSVEIFMKAPREPGVYQVEFDMVVEGYEWFDSLGSSPLKEEIKVEEE